MAKRTPQTFQDTLTNALAAQKQEFDAYENAWKAGDLDALQAHHDAYLKACDVVSAARRTVESAILNTPEAQHGLAMLDAANKRFADATAKLARDAKALAAFTAAAGLVTKILGMIA